MFQSLPVLMYHFINNKRDHMSVPPDVFADHCAVLARAGWRGVSLAEAEAYFTKGRRLPRRACLFTFDDGYLDNYVQAAPILRDHGHQGALFPVLNLLERREAPRPDRDDLARGPERARELPDLDKPILDRRLGIGIGENPRCSPVELRRMLDSGTMTPAPHSLRHHNVVSGPDFNGLFRPGDTEIFYRPPAFGLIWGMPCFDEAPALATRAYILNPKLPELVRRMVPQEADAARAFLAIPANRRALLSAIKALPSLGRYETEAECRDRIFAELSACQEKFERLFGRRARSFCWPWGAYSPISMEEGKRAGFEVFFTTARGANPPGGSLAIKRFSGTAIPGRKLLWLVRLFSATPTAPIPKWGVAKALFRLWR